MIVFAVFAASFSFFLFSTTYRSSIKSTQAKIEHLLSKKDDVIDFEQYTMTFYGRLVRKTSQVNKDEVYKRLQRHQKLLIALLWFSLLSCLAFPIACFFFYTLPDIGKLYAFAFGAVIGLLNIVFLPVSFRPINL